MSDFVNHQPIRPIWSRLILEDWIRRARQDRRFAASGQVERWLEAVKWYERNEGEGREGLTQK